MHYRWTILLLTGETMVFESVSAGGIAPFNNSINVFDLQERCWVFNWESIVWYHVERVKEP